jgi:hypothetical protein
MAVDPRRTDGELVRAAETVKKMVVARARGVENFGWFIFKHTSNSYNSPYNNYSSLNEDGTPRPVLLAYNNTNRWLRNSVIKEIPVENPRTTAYEADNGINKIFIAWSNDPEVVISFSQLPDWVSNGADIYDMFGGPASATVTRNPLTINLSGNPVFFVSKNTSQ